MNQKQKSIRRAYHYWITWNSLEGVAKNLGKKYQKYIEKLKPFRMMRMVLEILRYFLFHVPQQQSTDNWNEHEKKNRRIIMMIIMMMTFSLILHQPMFSSTAHQIVIHFKKIIKRYGLLSWLPINYWTANYVFIFIQIKVYSQVSIKNFFTSAK